MRLAPADIFGLGRLGQSFFVSGEIASDEAAWTP